MSEPDSKGIVLKYVVDINSRNSDALMALQTEDLTFIDYEGDTFVGGDGWQDYFTTYPEYMLVFTF